MSCFKRNCKSLESVTLSGNIEDIGDGTFSGCTNLKYIRIPDVENLYIGKDILDVGSDTVINTPQGSIADEYAQKYHLLVDYNY